jgi:hypothetical protein
VRDREKLYTWFAAWIRRQDDRRFRRMIVASRLLNSGVRELTEETEFSVGPAFHCSVPKKPVLSDHSGLSRKQEAANGD